MRELSSAMSPIVFALENLGRSTDRATAAFRNMARMMPSEPTRRRPTERKSYAGRKANVARMQRGH